MLTIGFNTRPLTGPNAFRGVGKYTQQLLTGLYQRKDIKVVEFTGDQRPEKVDLVHYPYFDFYFHTLPLRKRFRTVVTIHDCIPLIFPKQYPAGIKGQLHFNLQKLALSGVSLTITDSVASQRDVVRYLGFAASKIQVIYLAADPIFKVLPDQDAKLQRRYKLNGNFVFYAGDVNYNKNLPSLIRAFGELKNRSLSLVLAGKAFEDKTLPEVREIQALVDKLKLVGRVKILGYVPDQELVGLYNLALVYCQPSYYEGFGLQVLEAMACGCPVVTTKVSSPPEISGKAALLVDPHSVAQISRALESVVGDQRLRQRLVKSGLEQVKNFSWERTVEETVKAYRCLA